MLPQGITKFFGSLLPEKTLLAQAQNNLESHIKDIEKYGAGVFLSSNGQAATAVMADNQAYAARSYWWNDTEIDAQFVKNTIHEADTAQIYLAVEGTRAFANLREKLRAVDLDAHAIVRFVSAEGSDPETATSLRIGLQVAAPDQATLDAGLQALREEDHKRMAATPINITIKKKPNEFDLHLHDNRHEL